MFEKMSLNQESKYFYRNWNTRYHFQLFGTDDKTLSIVIHIILLVRTLDT